MKHLSRRAGLQILIGAGPKKQGTEADLLTTCVFEERDRTCTALHPSCSPDAATGTEHVARSNVDRALSKTASPHRAHRHKCRVPVVRDVRGRGPRPPRCHFLPQTLP